MAASRPAARTHSAACVRLQADTAGRPAGDEREGISGAYALTTERQQLAPVQVFHRGRGHSTDQDQIQEASSLSFRRY
jgi:hypothetical protein